MPKIILISKLMLKCHYSLQKLWQSPLAALITTENIFCPIILLMFEIPVDPGIFAMEWTKDRKSACSKDSQTKVFANTAENITQPFIFLFLVKKEFLRFLELRWYCGSPTSCWTLWNWLLLQTTLDWPFCRLALFRWL